MYGAHRQVVRVSGALYGRLCPVTSVSCDLWSVSECALYGPMTMLSYDAQLALCSH